MRLRGVVGFARAVNDRDAPVARDAANVRHGTALACADGFHARYVVRVHQRHVALLVLGSPLFQRGQRHVAKGQLRHVHAPTRRRANLFGHVRHPTRALVVQTAQRVVCAALRARAHHAAQLVAHQRVATLHRALVDHVAAVGAPATAGRGAAPYAHAVRQATDAHDAPARGRRMLAHVRVVDHTHTAREQDGFEPFGARAVRVRAPVRPCEPVDNRLAKRVAVVRRAVARTQQHRARVVWHTVVVVRAWVVRSRVQPELAHRVARRARHDQATPPNALVVAQPPANARRCPCKRRDRGGEVVCFCGERGVHHVRSHTEDVGRRRDHEPRHVRPTQGAGVVRERNDRRGRLRGGYGGQRGLDEFKERVRQRNTVAHELAVEQPMPRVLAVGLRQIEQLHVGRVTSPLFAKQASVQREVVRVHREVVKRIEFAEVGNRHTVHVRQRRVNAAINTMNTVVERQRRGVHGFQHRVSQLEPFGGVPRHDPSTRALHPPQPTQPTRVQNGHRVRRPRGFKVQLVPRFEHAVGRRVRHNEVRTVELECVGFWVVTFVVRTQDRAQDALLVVRTQDRAQDASLVLVQRVDGG